MAAQLRERVQVRFREFDTTSEVSASDGSRFMVVSVTFDLQRAARTTTVTVCVGISQRHGRKSYEIIDEPWSELPELAAALIDYVRQAERRFRFVDLGLDRLCRELERSVELEMDVSALP